MLGKLVESTVVIGTSVFIGIYIEQTIYAPNVAKALSNKLIKLGFSKYVLNVYF